MDCCIAVRHRSWCERRCDVCCHREGDGAAGNVKTSSILRAISTGSTMVRTVATMFVVCSIDDHLCITEWETDSQAEAAGEEPARLHRGRVHDTTILCFMLSNSLSNSNRVAINLMREFKFNVEAAANAFYERGFEPASILKSSSVPPNYYSPLLYFRLIDDSANVTCFFSLTQSLNEKKLIEFFDQYRGT